MIVGLCGSSSTGKTTLIAGLKETGAFERHLKQFIGVNARGIIASMGFRSVDDMDAGEYQEFQRRFLLEKLRLEDGETAFCTDRTFVDIAAYWLCKASVGDASEDAKFLAQLRSCSKYYDLHVFCPFGVLPFTSDGYRSSDMKFHQEVSDTIKRLLDDWGLRHIELSSADLSIRMEQVVLGITTHGS